MGRDVADRCVEALAAVQPSYISPLLGPSGTGRGASEVRPGPPLAGMAGLCPYAARPASIDSSYVSIRVPMASRTLARPAIAAPRRERRKALSV